MLSNSPPKKQHILTITAYYILSKTPVLVHSQISASGSVFANHFLLLIQTSIKLGKQPPK